MNILALDCETLTHNKGSPYDSRNKMVCYSIATSVQHYAAYLWPDVKDCQTFVDEAKLVVGFNFKFDLHWFEKEGVDLSKAKIWDVQIAEFILSNQTAPFPSLNETCIKYNIPTKLDVVKTEYWDKGVQTDEIPWPVLSDYAAHDAKVTLLCYYAQLKLMTPQQIKLCQLMCQDLYILKEMECNGIVFDENLCVQRSMEVDDQIEILKAKLSAVYPNVPINFNSNDHLSAFLYGGVVKEDGKEHVGFYKTGAQKGQPKYKNVTIEHVLPRLYQPLKGSELEKEGMFSTNEATLKKLKGKKAVISLLLELAKLEKRNGTYYKGLVTLREKMHWPKNKLHGQFNQTTAATGRLSSSKPNLQNFDSELLDIFISEYNE